MSKITKSWIRGLARGYENSGEFVATTVPIAMVCLVLAIMIGTFFAVRDCRRTAEVPKPCADYSYKLGRGYARCTQWPAMEVRTEKRWVKSDMVHCTCSAESHAAPSSQ